MHSGVEDSFETVMKYLLNISFSKLTRNCLTDERYLLLLTRKNTISDTKHSANPLLQSRK